MFRDSPELLFSRFPSDSALYSLTSSRVFVVLRSPQKQERAHYTGKVSGKAPLTILSRTTEIQVYTVLCRLSNRHNRLNSYLLLKTPQKTKPINPRIPLKRKSILHFFFFFWGGGGGGGVWFYKQTEKGPAARPLPQKVSSG